MQTSHLHQAHESDIGWGEGKDSDKMKATEHWIYRKIFTLDFTLSPAYQRRRHFSVPFNALWFIKQTKSFSSLEKFLSLVISLSISVSGFCLKMECRKCNLWEDGSEVTIENILKHPNVTLCVVYWGSEIQFVTTRLRFCGWMEISVDLIKYFIYVGVPKSDWKIFNGTNWGWKRLCD